MDEFGWFFLVGCGVVMGGALWAVIEDNDTLFPVLVMIAGMFFSILPAGVKYGEETATFRKNIIEKVDLSEIPMKGIKDCSATVDLNVRYVDGKAQPGTFVVTSPVVCKAVENEVKSTE